MKEIPTESIDLVVTDCPYRICCGGTESPKHINLGGIFNCKIKSVSSGRLFKHNDIVFSEWLPEVYRVLKNGTHCYVMVNSRNLKDLQTKAEQVGFIFQNLLVWDKRTATPNRYYMQALEFILMLRKGAARSINAMGCKNIFTIPNIVGTKRHPTEKPVLLMMEFIRNSSNDGDIVLDPFAGSGSTLIAAKRLNRRYIGYEIDPDYYTIAVKRLREEPVQTDMYNGLF